MAAVDGKLVGNGASGGHLLEDALPDTTLRPAIVTVVDRCRRPIDGRNARDDRAVVDARLTRPAAWQVRAERLPGLIRQPDKPFAMTIAPSDSNQAQIYNQNQ